IITAVRKQIIASGGEVLFEKRLIDFIIKNEILTGVKTTDGNIFEGEAVILATGHSARDIFQLLYNKKIEIESKPFALGVRVEHPQELINSIQYHCMQGRCDPYLPPASYSLVHQVEKRGVFSFCMCPGGIIAPAATSEGELVVNGWSPSKRNNPYANSGIVVQIQNQDLKPSRLAHSEWNLKDFEEITQLSENVLNTPLGVMYFQQYVERKAYSAGGGKFVAPAQRLIDFCENKLSVTVPDCSYLPGIHSSLLNEVLPSFVHKNLQKAFREFAKKMKGYFTNDAVVVATESRTSSPVRIPRDAKTLQHRQIKNLFPCGEGAGYAGGIVSAALDGERVADKIAELFNK
ncbi:MAG TPA: FAD-binding protein, partial [Ignavibacteria bacterium]